MTFPPETQEAIWVNMETGTGVNFVAGPDGPTYSYWFGAKDALVLMIRKEHPLMALTSCGGAATCAPYLQARL